MQSTFASGLSEPFGLAFNSADDLFVADTASGNIYEFTPDGVQSTFASGLVNPSGLAFDGSDDLFVAFQSGSIIDEITPGGTESFFANNPGADGPAFLAVQLVPEPSVSGLLAVGATPLLIRRRFNSF